MSIAILRGDARLLPLPDASVDLICTSPPYWNLRDYRDGGESLNGQIGSEETPQEWLKAMWDCTREWMRVLKPGGSIFVDLGDRYSARADGSAGRSGRRDHAPCLSPTRNSRAIARPKSLLLLPERYRIGCADHLGLIVRAKIVWSKPSPLPESARDRVHTAHEDIVHLVKQPSYFSAVDEIRIPHTGGTHARRKDGKLSPKEAAAVAAGHRRGFFPEDMENPLGKVPGSVWEIAAQPFAPPDSFGIDHFAAYPFELPRRIILGWSPAGVCAECGNGRYPVATRSRETYYGAGRHRPGARQIRDGAAIVGWKQDEKWRTSTALLGYACSCTPYTDHPERRGKDFHDQASRAERGANDGNGGERYRRYVEELANPRGPVREYHFGDWVPAPTRPAVVVDPFGGTGTSALVADVLGRHGISVDRSGDYCRLARWRTTDPGERARAMQVPKPPVVPDGQDALFSIGGAAS